MNWIDFKTQRPTESGEYIIYGRFTKDCPKTVYAARFIKQRGRFQLAGIYSKDVTHWMEMPEAPVYDKSQVGYVGRLLFEQHD